MTRENSTQRPGEGKGRIKASCVIFAINASHQSQTRPATQPSLPDVQTTAHLNCRLLEALLSGKNEEERSKTRSVSTESEK